MTTSTHQVSAPASAPTPVVPVPTPVVFGSSGMGQISSGPAALLYSLANQMIALYNDVQADYGNMTKTEIAVQSASISSGAKAQIAAATSQMWEKITGAIGAGVGAACSLAPAISMNFGAMKDTQIKLSQSEARLDKLNTLGKQASDQGTTAINQNRGGGPRVMSFEQPGAAPEVTGRANAFRQGNFERDPTTNTPYDEATNNRALENLANWKKPGGGTVLDDVRVDLRRQISDESTIANSHTTTLQKDLTKATLWKDMASGVVNAGSQGIQAHFTSQAAGHSAVQQQAEGTSRLAASMEGTTGQKLGETGSFARQLTDAARSGSQQSYANT